MVSPWQPTQPLVVPYKPADLSRVTVVVRGSVAGDWPTITLYSPGTIVERSVAASKIDKYNGSILSVTVLLSSG